MKTLKESILSRSSHSSETTKNMILIEEWLKRYNIKNYTIKDNFEIDVDGYVDLYKKNIIEFPEYIQFGVVEGYFDCSYNKTKFTKKDVMRVCNINSNNIVV